MQQGGFLSLLKDGARHLSGTEEATLRNIEACKALAHTTRTSMGPNGMNKMVIDSRDRLFVTSDAATIVKELEVVHPAAKLLVMASERQEQECGDGSNFVITLAGELLQQAEGLLHVGLHTSEIIAGYRKAGEKALALLEELSTHKLEDLRNVEEVSKFMRSVVEAKQAGSADHLVPLIARACIDVLPNGPEADSKRFNVDNVRVLKVLGGGIVDSSLVHGMSMLADAEGTIKHMENARIGVFVSGIDVSHTEAKGTVRFRKAEELENFSRNEETELEKVIQEIKASGCNVVVSGQAVGQMALHFLERYDMMVLKVASKFQLRRLCRAVGARPLVRLGAPTPEELGAARSVSIDEIGSTKVCNIAVEDGERSQISTLVLRGSSHNVLNDVERCVDDGVNTFKAMTRDGRFVPGAGATEIELARRLQQFGESAPGLDQYAIKKFAESLEAVPRILAENTGMKSTDAISSLYASHEAGHSSHGIDIARGTIGDAIELGVFDCALVKHWAIKLAVNVATTVLSIDQIVMMRAAGGPSLPKMGARDET